MAVLSEFALISRYFAPLAGPEGLGLKDDAAHYSPPPGFDLTLTVDANVAGVHFLPDEAPDIVARRLLRTNLSDLAAKGAKPVGYLLTLALSEATDTGWVQRFASGLAADQETFGLKLFGGDTVSTPGPVMASITALGLTPAGKAILRSGAKPGDAIYVSGTIGDAGLGLKLALDRGASSSDRDWLVERFRLPTPRLELGAELVGVATAAADVSDGLIADAGHIAEAAGVVLEIQTAAVPLSAPAQRLGLDLAAAITSGDDYEIVFTGRENLSIDAACIGAVRALRGGEAARAVALDASGREIALAQPGYTHR